MKTFSLRTLIDDILLIVRNNNISESEDLSRDQIRAWIIAYKAYLSKKEADKDEEIGNDDGDSANDSMEHTIGPMKLQDYDDGDNDDCCFQIKRTKDKIQSLMNDSESDIKNITLRNGCVIQLMPIERVHYHHYRRYTSLEPLCWFDDGHIYIKGDDIDDIDQIYVTGLFSENPEADSEDDELIPGWMIPDIKKAIMVNELAFMLKRPSDDSNNSTLASVKPHGPQDQEK